MKYFISSSFLILFAYASIGQDITFYASAKGQIFGSTIINRSITVDEDQNYSFALSGSGGVGGALYFYDKIGLSLDFLLGNHKAVYSANEYSLEGEPMDFKSEISFRSIHIPILLSILTHDDQKKDVGSGYFEIGPQFNNCMSPTYTRSGGFSENISELCSNTYWSGILGFGMLNSLGRRSRFNYSFGLRIEYGLKDLGSVNAFGIPFESNSGYKSIVMGIGFQLGLSYQLPIETNASWLQFLK